MASLKLPTKRIYTQNVSVMAGSLGLVSLFKDWSTERAFLKSSMRSEVAGAILGPR